MSEHTPIHLPEQHPRTEPPSLTAPTFASRDALDPLSPELLARMIPDVEQAIAAMTRLRRTARAPLTSLDSPGLSTEREALAVHVYDLEAVLAVAVARSDTSHWLAWRRAWDLYVRACKALNPHRVPRPELRPPDGPSAA